MLSEEAEKTEIRPYLRYIAGFLIVSQQKSFIIIKISLLIVN